MKNTKINKKKSKINIDFVRLGFSIAVIYFVISFCYQQRELNYYKSQKDIYIKGIKEQQETLKKYDEQKNQENTDEIMENYARDLGYVKPYEKIFIDINK